MEDLLNNIDLELLKEQKLHLRYVQHYLHDEVACNALEGVLSLLDSIHDLLEPIE